MPPFLSKGNRNTIVAEISTPSTQAMPSQTLVVLKSKTTTGECKDEVNGVRHDKPDGKTPTASAKSQQAPLRRPAARAACTHVHMDKVFNVFSCQICHRTPAIGWVYVCQQDDFSPRTFKLNKARKKLRKNKRHTSTELELLGFNKSIIKAVEGGYYTRDQLATMKQQKQKVQAVIHRVLKEKEAVRAKQEARVKEEVMKSKAGPPAASLEDKLAALTVHETSEISDKNKSASLDEDTERSEHKSRSNDPNQACEFRVCHTCRPLSRDRSFVSFESVLHDEVQLPGTWIEKFMPVANVKVVRSIGLRGPPPHMQAHKESEPSQSTAIANHPVPTSIKKSGATIKGGVHNFDSNHRLRTKRSLANLQQAYNAEPLECVGFRTSLTNSLRNMARRRLEDVSNGKDVTFDEDLEKLFAYYHEAEDFDLGLWKAMTDDLLLKAASVELPGADGKDELDEPVPDLSNGHSRQGGPQVQTDISSDGLLLQHGRKHYGRGTTRGLALTEEAAETHTPDIVLPG